MKHLIYFEDYLTESVLDIDSIYTKYYISINREVFDKIILADPTTALKDSKMGVYCKWLLKLYTDKKLKLEDLYKATEYLSAFRQFKHKISQKDINHYKSLPELFESVEPFLEKEETKFENDEERKLASQFKEVFRNEKYRIIIPLTLKASQYFGRETEWCTTHSDMFDSYTEDQEADKISKYNLYIFYTENLSDRMQFHFNERQFMDINDRSINEVEFFEDNKDIQAFFAKENWFKYYNYNPEDYLIEYLNEKDFTLETEINEFLCDVRILQTVIEFDDYFGADNYIIIKIYDEDLDISDMKEYFNDIPLNIYEEDFDYNGYDEYFGHVDGRIMRIELIY